MHEGSATAAIELRDERHPRGAELRERAELAARAFDRQLALTHPAWLGHCKILLQTAAPAYVSLTGAAERLRWAGRIADDATATGATIYAVIWGASDDDVALAVAAALAAFAP